MSKLKNNININANINAHDNTLNNIFYVFITLSLITQNSFFQNSQTSLRDATIKNFELIIKIIKHLQIQQQIMMKAITQLMKTQKIETKRKRLIIK